MNFDEFKQLYPFSIERSVEWADMDAFQHVNNTVYFRYFEKIRIDYFQSSGLMALARDDNIGPILASTQCRFRVPLTYPDTVIIGTCISELEEDRFLMKYGVYSLGHDRLAAEGDGLVVCYDYDRGVKAPIPEAIYKLLKSGQVNASR